MSSPLRQRPIAALVTAEVASSLGSQMTFLALPWFVLATTGSPARMSLVLAVELLPIAILGIPSGAVISRLGARRTMLWSDLARAPLLASIPVLHSLDRLSFGVLLVIVAGIGVFLAPYWASQRLVLPEILGDDEATVAQANAIIEGAQRATSLGGPVLAGLLIGVMGAANVLYLDAATFLVAFCLVRLFVPQRAPAAPTDESGGVLAGVRVLVRDPFLRVLGLTALFANGFGQMLIAGLPVLAYEDFDGSSRIAGAFFAGFGAGAVLGAIAAVRLVKRYEPLRLSAVAFVAFTIPLFALAFELPAPGVVLALLLSSFFGPIVNAPLISVIMIRTPEALRAKVMTAVITTAMLAGPLGMLIAGPLLQEWGPQQVFLLVATGQLLATIPFALVAFRSGEAQPAAAG